MEVLPVQSRHIKMMIQGQNLLQIILSKDITKGQKRAMPAYTLSAIWLQSNEHKYTTRKDTHYTKKLKNR